MSMSPRSHERAFALQKYVLLDSQHDALQQHLSQIRPPIPSSPVLSSHSRNSFVSSSSDAISSMTIHRTLSNPRHKRPSMVKRRSSLPEEARIGGFLEEERQLRDVNLQLKNTLMELLACETVRGDERNRRWVQGRLMEIEMELRGGRRESLSERMDDFGGKAKELEV